MGCTCIKERAIDFEALDNLYVIPDLTEYHKVKLQKFWAVLESKNLLPDCGINAFRLLLKKRPRLRLFFYCALVLKDMSVFHEDYHINRFPNEQLAIYIGNVSRNPDSKQVCFLDPEVNSSSQVEAPVRKPIPVNLDITEEELLQEHAMKAHITIIMNNLALLMTKLDDNEEFHSRLKYIQKVHTNIDIIVQKYICKSDFSNLLECLDLTFENTLPKRYKGSTKDAMRHFIKVCYFVITYYMPKDPYSIQVAKQARQDSYIQTKA